MSEALPEKFQINPPFTIVLPAILSVILFFLTIFYLVIPAMKSALMTQKKELIRDMTNLAWNSLEQFHIGVKTGQLTEAAARAAAAEHLRNIRYGPELTGYFWICDMHPVIVMHPFKPDLEGKEVTDFSDPGRKRRFLEFVKAADRLGSSYVEHQWQWLDDPNRIVSKISFVKVFRPWGWVVGTGIYIDDVECEISAITKKLTLIGIGILAFISALSSLIIVKGISVEKKRRIAEQEARTHQEHLCHASKMATIGTLAAGVAHEINNPITCVSLDITILKELWKSLIPIVERYRHETENLKVRQMDFKTLYERTPKLLEHMEKGAERIQNIVNELKDFSRVSSTTMENDVSINTAVEKAVALLDNLLRKTTNHLTVVLLPDPPLFKGNMQKVEQVIVNLLVNAAQALSDKEGKIKVATGYDALSNYVTVAVMDTGTGMSRETLERIRDPFFTTKQNSGNTGLGLAISQRIMEDHGGYMVFESTPGEGTHATLYFPLNKQKETV